VDATGWQGLFWIDAGIALACVPLTLRTVEESNDPSKPRTIDWAGTVLVACIFVPLVLALSEGNDWGWASAATLGCFAISIVSAWLFVTVEKRVKAPLVKLELLRNRILVGATLAILIVAGTINGLMYVLSLYFQNPAAFGFTPLQAGLATLPAAAGMIVITPFITRLASRIGGAPVVTLGFGLAAAGFAVLVFVKSSWTYAAFVGPLVVLAIGLGFANGPASSGSTAAVAAEDVGQASGISNMARYVGAALSVAAVAMVFNAVINNHLADGTSKPDALASGLASSALLLAFFCAGGLALAGLMSRHRPRKPESIDLAAAAAASLHTIPVPQRSR
jgi:predicted MFS family arabinose efflux permease